MLHPATDLEKLSAQLKSFFSKVGIKKAILFGSYAKGSVSRKSDIDLMFIMDTNKRFFDRYKDVEEIYEIIPDRSIDILIYTPEELERISHRSFIKTIFREGKVIYEHREERTGSLEVDSDR